MAIPASEEREPWTALDQDGKRRRLVEAAEKVFARDGLDAPVPAIAAEAGAGVGSVYRAFASKDELIAALAVERLLWFTREAGSGAPFEAVLRAVVERDGRDRVLSSALESAFERPDVAPVRAEAVAACERLLARAARAGEIRSGLTADDIRLLLIGIRAAERVSAGSGQRLLELALDGLRA